MNLALLSRFTDIEATGHYVTLFEALRDYYPGSINFTQKNNSGLGIEAVFPRTLKSTHNFITLNMLNPNVARNLAEKLRGARVHRAVIYDGALFDLLLTLELSRLLPDTYFYFNFHYAHSWANLVRNRTFASKLSRIMSRHQGKVFWLAESKKLSEHLSKLTGQTITEFPVFSNLTREDMEIEAPKDIDILLPPASRFGENWNVKFLEALATLDTPVRIVAQGPESEPQLPLSVTYVSGHLKTSEYLSLMRRSKFTVLPYVSDFHEWGSSGRFEDAVALNCLPLVSQTSGMSSRFHDRREMLPSDLTPEAFARAYNDISKLSDVPLPRRRTPENFIEFTYDCERQHFASEAKVKFNFVKELGSFGIAVLRASKFRHFLQAQLNDMGFKL